MIEMKNVSLWRGKEFLLKNINWQVQNGEHWAILGLNGSGKTTLLNMINGYLFPSHGEVEVLNRKFGEYDLRELRKSIGWVSTALQERLYVNESALEIVISGKMAVIGLMDNPSEEDRSQAMKLLTQLDCKIFAHRAYQTLSQGEKQKVLIARALMAQPRLLILDEPCTGLDLFAREQLLHFIDQLGRKPDAPMLLYVTHRTEEILPIFNRTLLLKKGEIYLAGPTEEVLTSEVLTGFFGHAMKAVLKQQRIWVNLVEEWCEEEEE